MNWVVYFWNFPVIILLTSSNQKPQKWWETRVKWGLAFLHFLFPWPWSQIKVPISLCIQIKCHSANHWPDFCISHVQVFIGLCHHTALSQSQYFHLQSPLNSHTVCVRFPLRNTCIITSKEDRFHLVHVSEMAVGYQLATDLGHVAVRPTWLHMVGQGSLGSERARKELATQCILQGYTSNDLTSFHEVTSPKGSAISQ